MTTEVQGANLPTPDADELSGVLRDYMDVARRLQQTHDTLRREVVRLRHELESKDRELERRRRLASLGELAAGVAHEVRNPLGAIQLYSGLLRSQIGELGPATELVEKIDAGIRTIDCIVQDTLALAPRGGKLNRRSLRAILQDARDVCRATLEARRVSLEEHYEIPDIAVLADAAALQRVFVNLIANAAQVSPENAGVVVRVNGGEGGQVVVCVADQGSGLPEEIMDKMFDPFFTTKENGTGLGLTIAHRLVEAHGGSLTGRNRPEGGAEFVVVLPVDSTEEEQASQAGAGQPTAA